MSEQEPKFEKIIRGIEHIPSVEEEKRGVLEFSPQEKTEQLWAFWSEYRRKKYEILLAEKKVPLEKRKKLEEVENLLELIKLKKEIAKRWQDEEVQSLFKKELEKNLKEREEIKPELKTCHQKEQELKEAQKKYENLLRNLFVHRGEEIDELTQIELAELSIHLDILKDYLEKTFQQNPELAGFIQHERIKNYRQQFEESGFIWAPSRQKLFESILEHVVLLNKNRPMLLTGETGTGKTRLVRVAIERLTGRPPFEIGEEAKSDIRPLLGSASIKKDETYVTYGPLAQALTGKRKSLDQESDGGGIFYMDEMNGYSPDALRSLIKQVSGRAPGEKVTFAAWRGAWEKIAEKSGIIGAANLPDEERGRHLDRASLPVELARELTTLEVDYPEQTKENPEFYEMMLAVLMDKNNRVRLKEGELEPAWIEKVDLKTKEKTKELDTDSKSGGTLWRFSNLVAEIQKSYKGQENVLTPTKADASYLETAVLDPGLVFSWLREYRVSQLRKGRPLKEFLQEKLRDWSEQKTYSKEDRQLLKEFFSAFDLPIDGSEFKKSDIKSGKIFSEKEIGFLSPRVPRSKEKIEEPKPVSQIVFLEDGTEIEYQPFQEREELIRNGEIVVPLGQTSDGEIVIENSKTKVAELVDKENFENIRQRSRSEIIKGDLREISEMTVEKETSVIRTKTPEKNEISFDLAKEREGWQAWYQGHGFKVEIPEINLSPNEIKEIQDLIEKGYVDACVIVADQISYKDLGRKMTRGYKRTDQEWTFKESGNNGFKGLDRDNQPSKKFRLVFFKKVKELDRDPLLAQTIGRSPEQIEEFLEKLKQQGLNLESLSFKDYLIIQRKFMEETEPDRHIRDQARHLDVENETFFLKDRFRSGNRVIVKWQPKDYQLNVRADHYFPYRTLLGVRLARSFLIK